MDQLEILHRGLCNSSMEVEDIGLRFYTGQEHHGHVQWTSRVQYSTVVVACDLPLDHCGCLLCSSSRSSMWPFFQRSSNISLSCRQDMHSLYTTSHLTTPHYTSHHTTPHHTTPHSYHTTPHFTPHLTTPYLTTPHHTSHHTSPHLTSPHHITIIMPTNSQSWV